MNPQTTTLLLVLLVLLVAAACHDGSARSASQTAVRRDGPQVVWDPLHRPIAEIPFPNDKATRRDDDSPTGLRLNISGQAVTDVERRQREGMQRLSGAGTMGPISVAFSAPLDLVDLRKRHHPDRSDPVTGALTPDALAWDPSDHAIYLVNVEKGSLHYGELIPLDVGGGHYPHATSSHQFWPHDPMHALDNFNLPEDNRADTDGDGIPEFVYHWEVATNTLLLRSLIPMNHGAKHVLVLTKRLKGYVDDGADGWLEDSDGPVLRPVESPFDHVCPPGQEDALRDAIEVLASQGIGMKDVAFAWSFTTQDTVELLDALRRGLDGEGPFAYLSVDHPPVITNVENMDIVLDADSDEDGDPDVPFDNLYVIQAEFIQPLMDIIGGVMEGGLPAGYLGDVDYFVFGAYSAPGFIRTPDGRFDLNPVTGEGTVTSEEITFMISVPRARADCPKYVPGERPPRGCPPFPAMMYAHGTQTSRLEVIGIANKMAKMGIACWSYDSVGHGPFVPPLDQLIAQYPEYAFLIPIVTGLLADLFFLPDEAAQIKQLPNEEAIAVFMEIGLLEAITEEGRAEDENGDGFVGSGEAFYVADPFRVRDNILETVVDAFQLRRVIRALDQGKVPPLVEDPWKECSDIFGDAEKEEACWESLKANLLAGDFNADGVLDVGGPDAWIAVTGTSLGGMVATIAAAADPEIEVAVPIVPGAGFVQMFSRSTLHWVLEPTFLMALGPVVVGCPVEYADGTRRVALTMNTDIPPQGEVDDETGEVLEGIGYLTHDCRKSWETAAAEAPWRLKESTASLPLVPGAALRIRNLTLGTEALTTMGEDGEFSLGIPSDLGDRLEVAVLSPTGVPVETVVIESPYEGMGYQRNTPDFRRFAGLMQMVFETGDPANWVEHLFLDPLPGHPPVRILQLADVGDTTVPVSAMVTYSRAAGLFGRTIEEWYPVAEYLRLTGMLEGRKVETTDPVSGETWLDLWDCDDVDDNNGILGQAPAVGHFIEPDAEVGAFPALEVGDGWAAARYANVDGHHEYIGMQNSHLDPAGCCDPAEDPECDPTEDLLCRDYTTYYQNMFVKFVETSGAELIDDPCIESNDCELMGW